MRVLDMDGGVCMGRPGSNNVCSGQGGAHGSGACWRAGSLTLGRLKQLCERLFGLPAARQALAVAGAGGAAARPLDGGDDRDLAFLGLQVGS
jgi:hypothetical protein